MSKKVRRFLIVLATGLVGAYGGFHLGAGSFSAALADRDLRLRNLYSLWQNMCIDNGTEKPECDAAWDSAQRGGR